MSAGAVADDARWSLGARVTLGGLIAAASLSLVWLVHPWFDAVNDAAIYILTAKSLAAGEGYTYLGLPFHTRPPGFSALLAPLVAWRGVDFLALNLFVNLWGVAAIALLFAWARPRLGSVLAACSATCLWLNPGWREMCNQTMSDVPGVALLFLCLLLERRARRAPSLRSDVLLALALGLSAYVRSALVLLVPALVLQRLVERWRAGAGAGRPQLAPGRVLLVAVLPLFVLLPWEARQSSVRPAAPSDQTPLHSYSTGMWHTDVGDPRSPRVPLAEVLGRVPVRARQTLAALGSRLQADEAAPLLLVLGAGGLVLALFVYLRENRSEGWFLLGSLAVLLVYFDFRARLALPAYVLVLPALVEGARRALARIAGERAASLAPAVLLALLALVDLEPRPGWRAIERDHRLYAGLCREVSAALPPGACLAAPLGWRYAVHLDRPVYTLVLAWSRGSVRGVEELIDRHRIDHVLLLPRTDSGLKLGRYLLERYGVAQRIDELAVVRVR